MNKTDLVKSHTEARDESTGPLEVAPVESPSLPAPAPEVAKRPASGASWTIHISKKPGEKVKFDFGPGVGIRDINNIMRRVRFEFLAMKRRASLARKVEARRAAQPQGALNGR